MIKKYIKYAKSLTKSQTVSINSNKKINLFKTKISKWNFKQKIKSKIKSKIKIKIYSQSGKVLSAKSKKDSLRNEILFD